MDNLHVLYIDVKATRNFCQVVILANDRIIVGWHYVSASKPILARARGFNLECVAQWYVTCTQFRVSFLGKYVQR